MLYRAIGSASDIVRIDNQLERIQTEYGPALNYTDLTGSVSVGDRLLLNRTAQMLGLGTGGYDFVMANLSAPPPLENELCPGQIIKARYTPVQHAVAVLEEQPAYAPIWRRKLEGFPVLVGQLHSQLAAAAAALTDAGKTVAYVCTDSASLPIAFSNLVRQLKSLGYIAHTITCGQAFGGDYETVTVHSALLAAKYILECDAAIVIQGPGNAGTATKYGFSGAEQAAILDAAYALEGAPIAIVRMSSADPRSRHQGVSHHTLTTLELTVGGCIAPTPKGVDFPKVSPRHIVLPVEGAGAILDKMKRDDVNVTTMGRTIDDDRLFFEAAATAGILGAALDPKGTDRSR
jgi:hypothetical protein